MTITPIHPTDPSALIAAAGCPRPGRLNSYLTDYADRITTTPAWRCLPAADAQALAQIIGYEAVHGGESTAMRERATTITDEMSGGWADPMAVARALTIAATALDLL
jgi:hypothetical protein